MSLQKSYQALQQAFDANDLPSVGQQLPALKLLLTQSGLLFPTGQATSAEDLVTARSVLEMGAFHSIRTGQIPAFERYMAQLEVFHQSSELPVSPHRPSLLSLSLLSLLSTSRISAFHTLLETLPPAELESADVREVVELERGLMEGSYNKVWRMAGRLMEKEGGGLGVLAEGLVGSIRNEIALSFVNSYTSLPIASAQQLLFFSQPSEVIAFASQRGWTLSPSSATIFFPLSQAADAQGGGAEVEDGGKALIDEALGYARVLESIV